LDSLLAGFLLNSRDLFIQHQITAPATVTTPKDALASTRAASKFVMMPPGLSRN
jgi:hypothetical protein